MTCSRNFAVLDTLRDTLASPCNFIKRIIEGGFIDIIILKEGERICLQTCPMD